MSFDIVRDILNYNLCVDLRFRVVLFEEIAGCLREVRLEKELQAFGRKLAFFSLMHASDELIGSLIIVDPCKFLLTVKERSRFRRLAGIENNGC